MTRQENIVSEYPSGFITFHMYPPKSSQTKHQNTHEQAPPESKLNGQTPPEYNLEESPKPSPPGFWSICEWNRPYNIHFWPFDSINVFNLEIILLTSKFTNHFNWYITTHNKQSYQNFGNNGNTNNKLRTKQQTTKSRTPVWPLYASHRSGVRRIQCPEGVPAYSRLDSLAIWTTA